MDVRLVLGSELSVMEDDICELYQASFGVLFS